MVYVNEIKRQVRWQAHQSSNAERPENTMAAIQYAWELGGIPELDIRQTSDGIIIGLHDHTLRRTTNAPPKVWDQPASGMTFHELQQWDAGLPFGAAFRGERIPALEQVLLAMDEHESRELYLDYKEVDLQLMTDLIARQGLARRIIFAHCDHDNCRKVKQFAPDIRTMLWITGTQPEATAKAFANVADSGFDGLDIIQLHLVDRDAPTDGWRYRIGRDMLRDAQQQLTEAGLELEVLIARFDEATLFELLDLGIRRFAVDEPMVFLQTLDRYQPG